MKYVVFVMIAVCFMFGGCSEQPTGDEHTHIVFWEDQYRDGDSLWYVCYGTTYENKVEELSFVLFETGALENPPGIRRVVTRDVDRPGKKGTKQEGFLIHFVDGMTQLPTETQLYEIVDSRLTTRPERVTLAQIKGYIESEPSEYTLESLLAYSKENK